MRSIIPLALAAGLALVTLSAPSAHPEPAPALSRFEQFFAGYGAAGGPSDLVTLLTDLGHNNLPVASAMQLPDSRSLQRAFVDCAHPRTIVAVRSRTDINLANTIQEPATFLGYAEKAHQAEVISWNPAARRYEFLVLSDFAPGKRPSLTRADRAVCVTCHQSEGPIFGRFPWSETSFQPNIRQALLGCPGFTVNKVPLTDDGFTFDAAVREGNRALQSERICQNLCAAGDTDCKRALLLLGLEALQANVFGARVPPGMSEAIRILRSRWPAHGFRYASSVLPDRDPLKNPERGGIASLYVPLDDPRVFYPSPSRLENYTFDESQSQTVPITAFGGGLVAPSGAPLLKELRIFGVHSLADPSEARPEVSSLYVDRLIQDDAINLRDSLSWSRLALLSPLCFGLTGEDVGRLLSGIATVAPWIASDPGIGALLGSSWPPARKDLLRAIFPDAPESSESDDQGEIDHDLGQSQDAEPSGPVNRSRALMNYQRFCAECHGTETYQARSGFKLPLDSLERLAIFGEPGLVWRYVRNRVMPIRGARLQPTDSERTEMAAAL